MSIVDSCVKPECVTHGPLDNISMPVPHTISIFSFSLNSFWKRRPLRYCEIGNYHPPLPTRCRSESLCVSTHSVALLPLGRPNFLACVTLRLGGPVDPKCLSCSENKGKKRYHKNTADPSHKADKYPGSNTLIDHVDAANVPGYSWHHKGRPTLKKYNNFMLFIDHKTRLVYPSFQESKTASEACRSKCDYEKFEQWYQVKVNSYHADNGAFHSETFKKEIDNRNQKLHFSGINAQWQNGLVERSNGTLCTAARSMLNHTISRWDKTITAEI
jgi:hypothetical protein